MFWNRKEKGDVAVSGKAERLHGPEGIPELVGRHLVVAKKQEPDWVWRLKAVQREHNGAKKAFDFRVFDAAKAAQAKIKIQNFNSLDQNPDLILFQGWYDKSAQKVELS